MADSLPQSDPFDRYSRQMSFAPLGRAGQRRLVQSRVLICGCGALGSAIATSLVRAGVGNVRIVDRDFLELSNLQRQVIYDEADVASALPKAIAASQKLRAINSTINIEPFVEDVSYKNIERLGSDCDAIVDGTDNFEIRFLLNDFALANGKPWVYGGVLGGEGQTMTIVPGETPCLACLIPEPPPPGTTPTCDTAGILGPAVSFVAALQSAEAIKLLSGNLECINRKWSIIDLWYNTMRQIDLAKLPAAGDCRACGRRDFAWLEGRRGSSTAVLCGRNAVQLRPDAPQTIDLAGLADTMRSVAEVLCNDYLLRAETDKYTLTLFPDGRAIVAGTDDVGVARSVYSQLVGS